MKSALEKIGWSSCSSDVATFTLAVEESGQEKKITAYPVDTSGPGWISRVDGHQMVGYVQHTDGDLSTLFFTCVVLSILPFL